MTDNFKATATVFMKSKLLKKRVFKVKMATDMLRMRTLFASV